MPNAILINKQEVLEFLSEEPLFKKFMDDDEAREEFLEYCLRTQTKKEYERIRKKAILSCCLLLLWNYPGIRITMMFSTFKQTGYTLFQELLNSDAAIWHLTLADTGYMLSYNELSIPHKNDLPSSILHIHSPFLIGLPLKRPIHVMVFEKFSDWIPGYYDNVHLMFISMD